jgi:hypothetical protein
MPIRFCTYITRSMLHQSPATLFVFGDNMERRGLGGQAAQMRGEPNAIGLPTKRSPERTESAYFRDPMLLLLVGETRNSRLRLIKHVLNGGEVIWPADGIGTGRAELFKRAPIIKAFYDDFLECLIQLANGAR